MRDPLRAGARCVVVPTSSTARACSEGVTKWEATMGETVTVDNRALEAAIERVRLVILQALLLSEDAEDRRRVCEVTSEALGQRPPYQGDDG